MICVDSSVAAKWLFAEEHSDKADALLDRAVETNEAIVAPPLLPVELTNIIRQAIRARTISLRQGEELLEKFSSFPVTLSSPPALQREALRVAVHNNLPAVYDAHYVALSHLLGATLWTADKRLLNALGGTVSFVRSIADYSENAPA